MNGTYKGTMLSGLAQSSNLKSPPKVPTNSTDTASNDTTSTRSRTSSGESLSPINRYNSKGVPVTPSRGQTEGYKMEAEQRRASYSCASAERAWPVSPSEKPTHSSLTSPSRDRLQALHEISNGSPQRLVSRRLSQVQSLVCLEVQASQRRDSVASHSNQFSSRSSDRSSFSNTLSTPTMQNSPRGVNTDSMNGVPEPLAVQELAFRQGQHDSTCSRDRIPSSPFAHQFDLIWAESYKLGRASGGAAIDQSTTTGFADQKYAWSVLINPYTQSFEHPNGFVDLNWTRKICEISLNSMEALIHLVCGRRSEWQKITCDIPAPVQQVLSEFPDLCERYEMLKRDAHQALGGGRPQGY